MVKFLTDELLERLKDTLFPLSDGVILSNPLRMMFCGSLTGLVSTRFMFKRIILRLFRGEAMW